MYKIFESNCKHSRQAISTHNEIMCNNYKQNMYIKSNNTKKTVRRAELSTN